MHDGSTHNASGTRAPRAQSWAARLFLTAAATALGLALGAQDAAQAIPFPVPVYEIIAHTPGHDVHLLNLGLGQPGVPQVPVPVDIDGDLLPDVTVAVNLVDTGGVDNPPNLPALVVPNVEITRLLTGSLLGQPLPPLRIEVKLRLTDLAGTEPDTTIRFGYDTGPGGSIPPVFKARLEGIQNFFNPLAATVDTGPSAGRPVTYDGPLRLVGGIQTGDSNIDLGLGFAPLPQYLRVGYSSDDAGQHITYDHSAPREVDARADIDVVDSESELHLDARVDRLPSHIAVDIAEGGSDGGAIEWNASSDGRRPDVDVHLESVGSGADDEPLYADLDVESLPPQIAAAWSLPTDGPTSVDFDAGGADGYGVGGVDVDIRNHAPGSPGALPAFVPEQQQFLSIRQEAAGDGSVLRRISGRVERVRSLSYSDADGVLAADVSMGDGEQPLEVSYDCRAECSADGSTRLVDVDTTVSPLPDDFSVSITDAGVDPRDEPMLIDYTASQPADVVGSINLAQAGSTGSTIGCGTARTVCADIALRDLPTELHTRLGQYTAPHEPDAVADEADLRLAVDLVEGSIAPDLEATVVLGPENPGEDPLVAEATALALPQHTRVYLHQHKETTDEGDALVLDRAAFHACDRAVDSATCVSGSEGEIGAVTVSLRSFLDRPAGFPVPLHDREQYATVQSTPAGLEVGARVEHVRDLEYLNTGPLQGVFASAGDGATPFTARIDIADSPADDVELDEDRILTGVTRDLRAEAVVTDLPPNFGVCFRTPNQTLIPSSEVVEGGAPFTADCEESTLDGDPLAFAYNVDFGGQLLPAVQVDGTFATTVAGEVDGEEYSETLEGEASVPEVPTSVIVQASLPEEDTVGPIDAVYDADATLDVDFAARMFVNDSRCLDPRPDAEAMCVEAYLNDIPSDATVHYDPTIRTENLFITSSGEGMDLLGLNLSTVKPRPEPIQEPFPTPEALIVSGLIANLPANVRGTIVLPEDDGDGKEETQPASTFIICASNDPCRQDGATGGQIGLIDLDARNVVVADPTPLGGTGEVPDPRDTGLGGVDDITDEILVFQRGHAFHASLEIHGVGGAGFRQVADDKGLKLETSEILLRFGEGVSPVIRAYADLDLGTERTIADVMLSGVPASTRFCFRGEENEEAPVDPTWCDTHGDDNGDGVFESGAVQLKTTPGEDASGLDVDAYVRQTAGGDATGMSGRVRITDLPRVLQGTIPAEDAGSLDIAGLTSENGAPSGIGGLQFEAATFDIEEHGFDLDQIPWFRTIGPLNLEDFPAPALGSPADPNHLSVVVTDDGFHARGRLDGLQHIALRDGLCDAPASVDEGNPTLYPGYFVPTDGTQPYTCARIAVDDGIAGSAAGEPFAMRAVARDGFEVVRLQDAGLTAFPRSFQMTLADGEVLKTDGSFNDACRPEPFVDEGCLPPMVRVDIDGDPSELFGALEIGTEDHLAELAGVDPRNPDADVLGGLSWADLDQIPVEGARVRVGTWSNTPLFPQVEEGVAAIARVRLPLPASLQIDAPQTWEDADPSPVPSWSATDIRMHYVARQADGTVIPSLGDLKVLLHTAPAGGQILLTGGEDLVSGVDIPGEMALAVYLREAPGDERMFVQADGHVSTDMSIAALIYPDQPPLLPGFFQIPSSSPDRIALDVLHIPGAPPGDSWDGWHDPGFRLQAEIIDDSPPPEECTVTSCSESSSRLAEVSAVLDFHPEGSATEAARLIQAVVHTLADGPMGVQVAGFLDPHGGGTTDAGWKDGTAEISLFGNLTIDPLHAYSFDGVPWLANWSITVDSKIELGISMERVKSFQLFNDTLGIVSQFDTVEDATPGEAAMGPIAMRPDYIYAGAEFLGVTVFGFELPPYNSGEVLPLEFPSCDGGDVAWEIIGGDVLGGSAAQFAGEHLFQTLPFVDPYIDEPGAHDYGYGVKLQRNTRNDILVFPEINLPFETGPGLTALGAGVLAEFLPGVAHGIGCKIFDLDEKDLITEFHPDVPALAVALNHLVPGAEDGTDTDPLTADLPPDANDNVTLGDESMCGRHHHNTIVVEGTVQVATSPGPLCEADDVGWLALSANEITVNGTIDADDVVTADCGAAEPPYSNYDFERDHATNPIVAYVVGPPISPGGCADYQAFGTGAGHGGLGGIAAGLPLGSPYDIREQEGVATAGYAGGNGSTSTGGGEGGGYVQLLGAEIQINGTISADGESATDAATDDCAVFTIGAGGGSGGGIAVLGNRVQFGGSASLTAHGGDGGNGTFFGGGGGAYGDIEVVAGIISPAAPTSIVPGAGGNAACAGGFDALGGNVFGGDFGHQHEGQASYVLPMGQGPSGDIWYTTNDVDFDRDGTIEDTDEYSETEIHVPIVATAADPNSPNTGTSDNGMTVVLCGVALTPDLAGVDQADRLFQLLTPDFVSPADPCGLTDVGGLARVDIARVVDSEYLPDQYHIDAFEGFDLSIEDLTANPDWCPAFLSQAIQDAVCGVEPVSAYYGLYTVVLRSSIPANDCLDPFDTGSIFDDFTSCWNFVPLSTNDPDNDCGDPTDFPAGAGIAQLFGFSNIGAAYDDEHCYYPNVEVPPGDAGPDVVIGIDNDEPVITAVNPDYYDVAGQNDTDRGIVWTNRLDFAGDLSSEDPLGTTEIIDVSGVAFFECFETTDGAHVPFADCDPDGTISTTVSPGDEQKELTFTVYDSVGNSSELVYDDLVLDTAIPSSALAADPDPGPLPNGWYFDAPALTISGFADPPDDGLDSGPHPDGRYVYQIDNGTEDTCQVGPGPGAETCAIPVEIGPGLHRVWFTAVDRAGNRGERAEDADDDVCAAPPTGRSMGCREFGRDFEAPLVEAFGAPDEFDGANGWWVTDPFVGIATFDLPVGGSGIDPDVFPSVLEVETQEAGQPASGFGAYEGPFALGDGTWTVRARGRDVAGNPNSTPPQNPPTNELPVMTERTFRIDSTAPFLALLASGPVGSGGWFTGGATVTPLASDFGSGMDPSADVDGVSGVFVSIDDGPFAESGPVFVGEGEHVVRAYAVDVAGNRTDVRERVVNVDLSHPVSVMRTTPADPARGPWFRSQPTIVLRATDGDQNAGVSSVRYCFGTGCTPTTTYTEPFTAPVGVTTLRWQAFDVSGAANDEAIHEQVLLSDVTPPVPVATQASKLIWSRLLGPSTIQLGFTVSDELTGPLQATVVIYDVFGNPVRRIDAAPINVNAGQTVSGSVTWNGKGSGLALVPIGIYHYRVVLTDHAGNVAESGESKPIVIKLL